MKSIRDKKLLFTLTPLIVVVGIFLMGNFAQAGWQWAYDLVGGILGVIISALGLILMLVIQALVAIASYQNFINSYAVELGWSIVRDVSNMFFVVILMVIAFGTILHIESYNYKKWLPKLILMAILINFSKTICGLLIDVSQVVMLTFVNAFKDIGGGNITEMLGISSIVEMAKGSENLTLWTVVGAYFLGILYLIVAIVVIITMTMMLAMRLVMIWIYVVLSPIAYLLSAFPGGQKYASQWWDEFTKTLIVGPVLAFFIWLSLASLAGPGADIKATGDDTSQAGITVNGSAAASEASKPDSLIKYIIGIGMLIGGLKMSSSIGGAVGGIASKGMTKLSSGAALARGYALSKVKDTAKATGRTALGATSKTAQGIGNVTGSDILKNTGKIGLSWRRDMIDANGKNKVEKREKFLKKIGFGEKAADAQSEFLKTKSGKRLSTAMHLGAIGSVVGGGPVGGVVGSVVGGVAGAAIGATVAHLSSPDRLVNAAQKQDEKAKKYTKKAQGQDDLSKSLQEEGKVDEANAASSKADKFREKAKAAENKSIEYDLKYKARQEKTPKNEILDKVSSLTSGVTQEAASNISGDIKKSRKLVKNAKDNVDDFMDDSGSSTFYTNSGGGKGFVKQLTDHSNSDSPEAIKNMAAWVEKSKIDKTPKGKANEAKMIAMSKMITAAKQGGVDVSSLGILQEALESKKSQNNNNQKLGKVSDDQKLGKVSDNQKSGEESDDQKSGEVSDNQKSGEESKVIPYRKTDETGEQGKGGLYVNTFANNLDGEVGKNVIGTDFNKLKEAGVDIDPEVEASMVSGSGKAKVAQAIVNQIDAELAKITAAKNSGEINEEDYNKSQADLSGAKSRLQNPESFDNLNLVNTTSKNFSRQARVASAYHENMHAVGVEDEGLTEGVTQKLMDNKLYGRNAATGGRHATEIGVMVKNMQDKGMNNDDILKQIDTEIKNRVNGEGKNRAQRVIKKESGEKESFSESEAPTFQGGPSTDEKTPSEIPVSTSEEKKVAEEEEKPSDADPDSLTPEINTEKIQASLDELNKHIENTAQSFKDFQIDNDNNKKDSNSVFQEALYTVKILNKSIIKNTAGFKKASGGQAPSSALEARALKDILEKK